LQPTSIKSSAHQLCQENENMLHHSSEGCLAGRDFQPIFPEKDKKIFKCTLSPDHSNNAQFAICMGEDSGHM
jgi:hypothetical protein